MYRSSLKNTSKSIVYLTLNNPLTENSTTETCLLKTVNDFCSELDKGNSLLVIALDLTAAFDTIDFEILDQIIEKRFFITGTCKEWIMSYITNRKQQTQVTKVLSSDSDVRYGVPQGSILGPLVFSMYITPIGDLLRKKGLRYQMYADDSFICKHENKSRGNRWNI